MSRFGQFLARPWRWLGRATTRAITSLPWSVGAPAASAASMERAISLIPLWACVRLLADTVSSLPIQLYRRNPDGTTSLTSYIPQLLFAPDSRGNLGEWLHKAMVSLCLRGNAYGLVTQRDPDFGLPTMIEWLNPDEVYVDETTPTRPIYYWRGRVIPTADIVHVPWFVLPGHVVGLSPVAAFAHTIGVGLSATQYGLSWFTNGGTPPAVMKNASKTVTPDEAAEISDRLAARMRSRKPLVIGSDWDFNALQVNPEESQFIETMRLNATQIAAIFGVPPTMVGGDNGGSMTYANVEQEANNLVVLTLRPWLVRLETHFSVLMPGREYLKFNVDAMIRTSIIDRYNAHGMALSQGWKNRDDIRQIEDMPPMPNGLGQIYGPLPPAALPPAAA